MNIILMIVAVVLGFMIAYATSIGIGWVVTAFAIALVFGFFTSVVVDAFYEGIPPPWGEMVFPFVSFIIFYLLVLM